MRRRLFAIIIGGVIVGLLLLLKHSTTSSDSINTDKPYSSPKTGILNKDKVIMDTPLVTPVSEDQPVEPSESQGDDSGAKDSTPVVPKENERSDEPVTSPATPPSEPVDAQGRTVLTMQPPPSGPQLSD